MWYPDDFYMYLVILLIISFVFLVGFSVGVGIVLSLVL